MADDPWLLKEDGYLNIDPDLKQIIYHSSLNVILICTESEIVHVLDVNSGVVLHSSRLSAQQNSKITCRYLTDQDKVLFCDGHSIGVRSDYNGVLLLDTILQKPVASSKDVIKLELLLSEAILLKQTLAKLMASVMVTQQSLVFMDLSDKFVDATKQKRKGIKAQKWHTICLELPLDALKRVADNAVTDFMQKNLHVPELAVAAAVQERLSELINNPPQSNDRAAMASEARRRETFSKWPHMDYKWALPDQMAQAGFFHQPNSAGGDRAMCFTCTVCLVCWERTDEPWSEHERHSPNCPFVMGEYTQNVPLSVTYATAPALDATYRGSLVKTVGSSGVSNLIATANEDGLVTVYDTSCKLKRTHSFYVKQYDSPILECCVQEFGYNHSLNHLEQDINISITSLSVVGEKKLVQKPCAQDKIKPNKSLVLNSKESKELPTQSQVVKPIVMEESTSALEPSTSSQIRPSVICGLKIKSQVPTNNINLNNQNSAEMLVSIEENLSDVQCLCVVVYDFQYIKETDRETEVEKSQSSKVFITRNDVDNLPESQINYGTNDTEVMTFINNMNYEALKMIKETMNYQNLIPGESDSIFLPPQTSEESEIRMWASNSKKETEETDASVSLIHQYINAQVNSAEINSNIEKSISDHIVELKSSNNKRLNYSHAIQCIALPPQYKNNNDLDIFEMIPTQDGNHLLVVLRSISDTGTNSLLIYALDKTSNVTKLVEKPVLVSDLSSNYRPIEVTVIPSVNETPGADRPALDGLAVIVCVDGAVRIVELNTLKILSIAKLESDKFVSAAYCNSLERLCAATQKGSLHFYALNEIETDFTDYCEEEDSFSMLFSNEATTGPSTRPDAYDQCIVGSEGGILSLQELNHLNSLCAFELLNAAYCVVVPPCWSEMQQAQRQRRHPQCLTGDDHHTRTWRLQTDTTTWDEHIFEITFPWPVCVGHLDVYFSLHSQLGPPHVEITLLRQNTSGIGHRRTEVKFQVDEMVSFEYLQQNQNPVTSREYLRSHNADILAGPINLADCVDLTEQNGCVTLTSPKLLKTNIRTVLLHIKALCDPSKEHNTSMRKEFKRNRDQSTSTTSNGATATTSTNKAEYYMGCDCLHELSITIYKLTQIDTAAEKLQRNAMLDSNTLLLSILQTATDCSSIQKQTMAFDILIWIASIKLARNRCANGEPPNYQTEFLMVIEKELEMLFKRCLLASGRSISHKCAKFMIICCDGARNISNVIGQQFDNKVLETLIKCLPDIDTVWSAGSLHWLNIIILRTIHEENHSNLAIQCVTQLCQIAHELNMRTNPYHLLLRSRFGLYGTPLEPELFDIDPPMTAKSISIPVTYASVANNDQSANNNFQNTFNDTSIDPKEIFILPSNETKTKLKSMAPNKHLKGLLETEPLHFACVAASDGTRVERFDPNVSPVNLPGMVGSVVVHAPQSQKNSGTKKADSDDVKDKDNVNVSFTVIGNKMLDENLAYNVKYNNIENIDEMNYFPEPLAVKMASYSADSKIPSYITALSDKKFIAKPFHPLMLKQENISHGNDLEFIEVATSFSSESTSQKSSEVKTNPWPNNEHIELLSPQVGQCSLQQLLLVPPQQVMVVERMQSGARRFITLDFGAPILLTDVIIPACHDLVSLSLDLWLKSEDIDAVRLVLSTDISSKTLVLGDLQPPPICRYIKITTIGRYGMSTTRCRIPIGNFFGHVIVLPEEVPMNIDCPNEVCVDNIEKQIEVLTTLLEDVSCRYSLACSRLKDLLHPWLTSDIPNSVHMAAYMGILRDNVEQNISSMDNVKVFSAYQEAIMYQRQLNIVQGVIRRIETHMKPITHTSSNEMGLSRSSTDKLRAIAESLLDVLLTLPVNMTELIDHHTCQQLFQGLCVAQVPRLQMLTATLLVKTCGKLLYWGDFIADTLSHMFSSNYTIQFPQDRVFVLLVYLGRKSPERGVILDSTLRILAEVLTSLSTRPTSTLLAVCTDLSLLGWILLYLSLQLDNMNGKNEPTTKRWNWVSGDGNSKITDAGVSTGNQKRKVQRRFMHYKQQMEQLQNKKAVQTSTQVQALSALSCQAATLSSKIAAALKQQEHVFKKIKQLNKQKELSALKQQESGTKANTSSPRETSESSVDSPQISQVLDTEHCLAVIRGIINLLLAMDHSCSADMFLLACKVVARLVIMANLSMCQIFSIDQLQQLMRQYVHSTEQPWMQHALSCLLQDLLEVTNDSALHSTAMNCAMAGISSEDNFEGTASAVTPTDMDTENQPAGPSWVNSAVNDMFDTFSFEENAIFEKMQIPNKSTSNSQLPSVFESDDSDLDDFLDDILERGRMLLRRNGAVKTTVSSGNISSALDARLELGVETPPEIQLRRLTTLSTSNFLQHIGSPVSEPVSPQSLPLWPEELIIPWIAPNPVNIANTEMLSSCFNWLFSDIQLQSHTYIEQTLRLWLTLNKTSNKSTFNSSIIPMITISLQSVNNLVSALVYCPNLTLRTWYVALQALTLICNMANTITPPIDWLEHSLNGMAKCLINHQEFVPMILRLLSGNGLTFSNKGLAGPSVCQALHDLLVRLLMRCDVITLGNATGVQIKELLLRLLYQLVQPSGPLTTRQGPLDVQCKFLQSLLLLDYTDTNLNTLMCILESTGVLISSYVSNVERIKCVNMGEKNYNSSNYFSGLFASVLGTDNGKDDRPITWELMLISLLKLLTKLIQTPLPSSGADAPAQEVMDTETEQTAQTDESKAERQQEGNREATTRVPCLADTVLQYHPSVMRLCHCLAACSGSSLAMLVGCTQQVGLTELGEPTTVGDAVFQLLSIMTQKTSKPTLILEPLVKFLRSAPQLSEPLLWFMLQIFNNEEMLRGFLNLDGVRVLAESMVRSGRTLSSMHYGTVSLVMHHMASTSSGASTKSDTILSYSSVAMNKKVQQTIMETTEALVNFAPMGSIRCHSGTAPPADVLIQSTVAPHRRARTPQWCYHFYPGETHTDLTIRLPCAVLLREVQLQPHLNSLSTCPSAVALEVSNGNPDHLVPTSPPFATSGMTFIRLHLPEPEVVTHVLLRLYKPRDACNIGLSQIRLLGTSAFGGMNKSSTSSDISDEETFSKFSLGWLRLLHHCFTLPSPNSELEKAIVTAAASVPDLLVTCCGLLLVPTHIPTLYLPNLEKVLCKLSLHDQQSGLSAIKILLNSKTALSGSTHVFLSMKTQMTLNSPATQSVCELLHQICGHEDSDTSYRVLAVLEWLQQTAQQAISSGSNSDTCSPAFISCIASVLWFAKEASVHYPLQSMITTELFDTIFQWVQIVENNIALKNALDCLLCSLCYIKNELFPNLLQCMNVLVPIMSTDLTASITDDRKDSESMTDDSKQNFELDSEWYGRLVIGELSQLSLTEAQLSTIAIASRSPPVIQQLLDSGLPKLLTKAILELCSNKNDKVPMARLENVTAILKFLADVCAEQSMREWLGIPDGSSFWLPLLQWLCNKSMQSSQLHSESRTHLEEVCVRFLSKCCLCHPNNQKLLARVLCNVISQQTNGISGFMRRLLLQLLLENEKVSVCIKADESIYKISPVPQPSFPLHPAHKRTHDRVLLQLSTSTTIGEILEQHIAFVTTLKTEKPKDNFGVSLSATGLQKEVWKMGIDGSDHISMAAGVTAKDKRAKDVKNQVLCSTPKLKKKRYNSSEGIMGITDSVTGRVVKCEHLPEYSLPSGLTLAQLLAMLETQPALSDKPCIHLTITHSKDDRSGRTDVDPLLQHRSIGNALQVFSSLGGLALLAQHLPAVYPEVVRPPSADKPVTIEQSDADWVKVEGSDDVYEDEEIAGSSASSKSSNVITNVPPHSLTAFGLFLRLPGYAEVLLKDMKKALCLLRLVLGVTDDGEGGDIFLSPIATSLPTLPFEVLRQLYDRTQLGTDDGRVLRSISINIGVTHLLLTFLAVFTHQVQPQTSNNGDSRETTSSTPNTDDKNQLYWAKGTGFGTGSTQQSWNVEQALLRQRSEEEHVTVLLQVLASYINPKVSATEELADSNVLPATFEQQISNSCLLSVLSSYLRNDSVLDMARHIPLYRAVLQLLRAITLSQQLIKLLLPRSQNNSRPPSIVSLLQKMKSCVDNYTCRLRFNKNSTNKFKYPKYSSSEELETDEGLTLLMPDIQETANIVKQVTNQLIGSDDCDVLYRDSTSIEIPLQQSVEQRYLDIMRRLQFDTCEMITECPEGYKFVISYHFESNVRQAGDQSQPARMKRLAQEAVTLATSLPLSYSSSVFVRCDADRLDIMKVLITGPADTPYANGCFELDVYFPPDYPKAPMLINLETTGRHTVRFNPNLYNDGKVCLSVLNTWHGRPEEKWNAQTSSFLQVLVSIQSLILVSEPYFNEPGYERSRGTPSGTQSSKEYNTNICQATVRWAMLEQILNPCPCFKEVIHTHFWLKKHEIMAQVEGWIADMEAQVAEKRNGRSVNKRTTVSNLETFKKNYHQLREQLTKLPTPKGLEDMQTDEDSQAITPASPHPTELDGDIEMEKLVSQVCE